MDQSVIIKGFSHGISVTLDPDTDYDKIKERLATRFRDSAKFLGNSKVALKFEGRKLSFEQEKELVGIISRECELSIVCLIEDDAEEDAKMLAAVENTLEAAKKSAEERLTAQTPEAPSSIAVEDTLHNAIFHKGSLRSGMEEHFDSNVLIIGDVNPGAFVYAKGSIIVLGSLRGTAYAGTEGNEKAFVLALDMAPVQIRIADIIARSPDRPAKKEIKDPQIAFLEDGAIYIEPVNKKILSEREL